MSAVLNLPKTKAAIEAHKAAWLVANAAEGAEDCAAARRTAAAEGRV